MEIGVLRDEVAGVMERATSFCDDVVEIVDGVEELVDDRLVDERPEVFSRLDFRGVGRQVDEPDPVGDGEVLQRVPAGIVEHEDDDAVTPGAGCAREVGEQLFEEGFVDAVRYIPDGLAA